PTRIEPRTRRARPQCRVLTPAHMEQTMHRSKHNAPVVLGRGRNYFRGGPNDPSALRGELGSPLLAPLRAASAHRGGRAIQKLRRRRLQDYLKLVVTLLPKEYRIKEVPLNELPDDEFNALKEMVRDALAQVEAKKAGAQAAPTNEGRPDNA